MHVLITGGGRGIGASTVALARERGWQVTFTYRADHSRAAEVAAATGAVAIASDIAADDPGALLDRVEQSGPLTALVNNAGITGPITDFVDSDTGMLPLLFETNLLGPMRLTQALVRRWLVRGTQGVVVNISSIGAASGSPHNYVGYSATKAGLEAFTMGLGKELGPAGIRVVGIAPASTDTEIHAAAGKPDRMAEVALKLPLGRGARPEEIAATILWALSDDASFVTATTIRVTGGG